MAQIQETLRVDSMPSVDRENRLEGFLCLQIEGQGYVSRDRNEHVPEGRDVRRQICSGQVADRPGPETISDDSVVVEYGNTVSSEPDVTFESRGPETQRQCEGFEGVLTGVGLGSAVGKSDHSPPH
jgi:hypothetical protein